MRTTATTSIIPPMAIPLVETVDLLQSMKRLFKKVIKWNQVLR
jgi:hypothetical protein